MLRTSSPSLPPSPGVSVDRCLGKQGKLIGVQSYPQAAIRNTCDESWHPWPDFTHSVPEVSLLADGWLELAVHREVVDGLASRRCGCPQRRAWSGCRVDPAPSTARRGWYVCVGADRLRLAIHIDTRRNLDMHPGCALGDVELPQDDDRARCARSQKKRGGPVEVQPACTRPRHELGGALSGRPPWAQFGPPHPIAWPVRKLRVGSMWS